MTSQAKSVRLPTGKSAKTLLRSYPEAVQALAEEARQRITAWLPGVAENVDPSARLFSYAHGPGYRGAVCTLILSKTGVKLGLVGGAALSDPAGLLAGAGKVHRHVQLSRPEDLRRPALKKLVLDASAACRARLGES
jgi:hypothetical protein